LHFISTKGVSEGEIEMTKCEWCGRDHKNGPATEKWHKAYAFIKENVAKIPFDQNGTKERFYPPWVLELRASDVEAQLWQILANAVIRRDEFKCQDCGKIFKATSYGEIYPRWAEAEVHHIVPRGLGGSDHPANLKLVCFDCHKKYNDKFNGYIKKIKRMGQTDSKSLEKFERS